MTKISQLAGLSHSYMNHCICATTVTSLREEGHAMEDIIAVT